ncbi:MAG: signal recognition particle-docking protein FtsY [Acidobacteria bacterium]|nr:signal recognition particle-docking protein FtsY [Acidobacteriota bacterium]
MAFWRRKKEDRFITLGLSGGPAPAPQPEEQAAPPTPLEPPALAQPTAETKPAIEPLTLQPTITGDKPTPTPEQTDGTMPSVGELPPPVAVPETASAGATERPRIAVPEVPSQQIPASQPAPPPVSRPAPVPPPAAPRSSSFSTSILGLNRSIEELQAEEAALEQTYAKRFSRAIEATRTSLSDKIDTVFQNRKQIDAELLDELEEALIAADIGVPTTLQILDTVRRGISRKEINDIDALKASIKNELLTILRASEQQGVAAETSVPENIAPYVMMIVGVNGVGKTTTIGKLAQRIKAEGNDVLICAADTFRAAASDQLAIWAERTGVPLIQQKQGTDPAAVLFDALKAAKARESDVLIVDTAGRLHNKSNLMAELEKMKRIAGREVESAPHETLLVIDAVTGQNGLEQARQFLKVAGVTGIVLTKLDGTAKGGIAVAIAKELGLPIRYAGIGEKVDDLVVFDAEQYVNSLFS